MVAEVLKPNVRELQKDVIDLLEQISKLMYRASSVLGADGGENKYTHYQQQINGEVKKVQNLELRMAIVAPMKAGKSTIVNAIIGQEILPSRNSAMTTLPTEIIFDAKLTEPVLYLSKEISSVFQETLLSLRDKIANLGTEEVQEILAQYPHLTEMPKQIQQSVSGLIPAKSKGRENIIQTLTFLNDIVRLCSIINPSADPIQKLTDAPRIRTPFRNIEAAEQQPEVGNLVIVDTPGPNEAGENLRLQAVVAEQLRQSSIVLIVLDFTQLKTEAAEKVKKDVEKVIKLRGKDNLYVLINKVDQRRDGDMTPEKVQQFVAAEFGIGNADNNNHVFEISARRAFTSANFLMELQHKPELNIVENKAARALAQEVFGFEWEEDLKETELKELRPKAEKLWKKSGFDSFLNGVINALMAEAAPRCMMSALEIARYRLSELNNDVQLRSSAVNQDAGKIQREIESLNHDLDLLKKRLDELKRELELIKQDLHNTLKSKLNKLNSTTTESIQHYFLENIAERINQIENPNLLEKFWKPIRKLDIEIRKKLIKPVIIPLLNELSFPKSISKFLVYDVALLNNNQYEFKTKQEAEEFAEQLVVEATEIVEKILYLTIKEIEREIYESQKKLNDSLKRKTTGVIDNARKRLNQAFSIELDLPPLLSTGVENNFEIPVIDNVTEYEPFNVIKTIANFFRQLFDKKYTEEKEKRYIVSIEKTVIQFNQSTEAKIKETEKQINQYLENDFKIRVDDFIKQLEAYLKNYQNNLQQALQDQDLSLTEKETIKKNLHKMTDDIQHLKEEIENKQKFVQQLMPKK